MFKYNFCYIIKFYIYNFCQTRVIDKSLTRTYLLCKSYVDIIIKLTRD